MKLHTLLEATQQEIYEDYLLANLIYGNLRGPDRPKFEEFYKNAKSKNMSKIAKYYLERKMNTDDRQKFLHDNKDDLKRFKFSGDFFDCEYGLGITIYVYDIVGAPPFKFKRGDEIFDFGVYGSCETLTEFPSWFPNHIARYQQDGTGIKSLKNIHKVIESCSELYFGTKDDCIRNISYLAGIKNLDRVEFAGNVKVTDAVNTYLDSTHKDERDILDLQDHLIDNGFEQFA